MRLTHIVTAVNDNEKYTKLIPLFIEQWKRIMPDIMITIIYIGENIHHSVPSHYHPYIHLFQPIEGIHTAYTAQVIRLLYPSMMDSNETIMITDMDMLPGNSAYFMDALQSMPDDAFVSLRPLCVVPANQIAMCYVVAKGITWKAIFNIHTESDIELFLKENYYRDYDGAHGGNGWYSDQHLLYNYVMNWKQKGGCFIELNDTYTKFNRLDYYHHNYDKLQFITLLNTQRFSDCHLYSHVCNWSTSDILEIIHMLK
jgi:hypothetical protein